MSRIFSPTALDFIFCEAFNSATPPPGTIPSFKAALKEGIIPGGGVALLNASQKISAKAVGEEILLKAIISPYTTILENAGITCNLKMKEGEGMDVITGDFVNMIDHGIIDPVLVTKSALKNAVSVVSTIISADCVISNMRMNESN